MSANTHSPADKGKANAPAAKAAQPAAPAFGELAGPEAGQAELSAGTQLAVDASQSGLPTHSTARRIRQQAVVQTQRHAGNLAANLTIQRLTNPNAPAPLQSAPLQRAPAPAAGGKGGTFQFGEYTLSTDAAAMRELIDNIATKKGREGARKFVYTDFAGVVGEAEAREGGSGASAGTGVSDSSGGPGSTVSASTDDLDTLRAIRPVLQGAYTDFDKATDGFLKDFENQAEGVVLMMLQQSEEKLRQEAERYGLTGGFGSLKPFEIQTGAAVENQGNKELAEAAGRMMALRQEADKAIGERTKLFDPKDPFRLFGNKEKENELTASINEKEEKIQQITGQFPILAGYRDPERLAQLAAMSQGGSEAALTVAPFIKKQLDNISEVRGGLERNLLKIWNLPTVVKGAKGQMGLGPDTLGNKLVDEHGEKIKSDAVLVNLAIAAVTITLGILAAVPTGGAGSAAVMAGASAMSAGISTAQAANALIEYQLAKAANATDPDKAKAISQEDPSLFWLALDIVGMIADIHGALAAFRAMSSQVRTVLSVAEDFEHLDDTLKSFKQSCDQAKVPGLYERVVKRISGALDKNKATVDDLKNIAQQRYAALTEAQKAEMLAAGITEEKFIAQIGANAQRDIVISGAEGVRRTQMVTELMTPGNPQIAAVLAGDGKAMDNLIKSHGNWQQLMSQLSAGTPEMKAASQKLVERRGQILKDIETKFFAKPAGGASTEAVSDVDLIAEGKLDAGSMMIQAEEYVKGFYGEGWSEALRMNFYTMADRLFMYAKEMKGLPAEMRGGLLKDLSKQTDMYNVAKMLEYAKGDRAALKRAEEYAKTLGVDINNPEITKLLNLSHSPKDRLNERNLLLIKADELMRKYHGLPPNASPEERMALAKEITENQMRANFFTEEAYMGPGAARMVVTGVDVVGFEAKMAVSSQLSMIAHEIAKYGGNVEIAMREYEIYKYINRFAAAARKAGSNHPGLTFYENMSAFLYKTERAGASTHAHLADLPEKVVKGAPALSDQAPRIGEVTDDYLRKLYSDFNRFSHDVMKELDVVTSQAPGQWTPFNVPRPAAGAPPKT